MNSWMQIPSYEMGKQLSSLATCGSKEALLMVCLENSFPSSMQLPQSPKVVVLCGGLLPPIQRDSMGPFTPNICTHFPHNNGFISVTSSSNCMGFNNIEITWYDMRKGNCRHWKQITLRLDIHFHINIKNNVWAPDQSSISIRALLTHAR